MKITFDEKKRLDTNPIFGVLVQGENLAERIQITGPKIVGALDLSQLRMAIRMTSAQYETTVEKTLEQSTDGDTITLFWPVDKTFTGSPGMVSVSLIGYGGNEEVIKITSTGLHVKEDEVFGIAPPESTWEQILKQMQDFATQAYESKTAAKTSELNAATSEQITTQKASEAAESAQKAIDAASVAANEAAAKAAQQTEQSIRRYADDRYARALKAEAAQAETLEIYPDESSNVVVTAYGFTEQAGSGDPSPVNVRKITVGGKKLVEVTITGDETITEASGRFVIPAPIPIKESNGLYSNANGWCNYYKVVSRNNQHANGSVIIDESISMSIVVNRDRTEVFITDARFKSVEEFRDFAKKLKENGLPIKFWYYPSDETKANDIYALIALNGEKSVTNCIPITAQLCEGDTVETCVQSGCDKCLVLDGSSDEFWKLEVSSTTKRFTLLISSLGNYPLATSYDNQYSNQLNFNIDLAGNSSFFIYKSKYGGGTTLFVSSGFANSVEDLRAKLAKKPIKFLYRSTSYTEENDIAICLETHKNVYKEYRVIDMNNAEDYPGWIDYSLSSIVGVGVNNAISGAVCSATTKVIINTSNSNVLYLSKSETGLTQSQFKAQYPELVVKVAIPCKSPIAYAHEPVHLEAYPDGNGKFVVTGEKTVSAKYNKSINRAFEELSSAVLAMGANLSL